MHTAVLGVQWGDEGKGKIIDFLAKEHDIIVRCQGGNNAGHTVVVGGQKYPFHLLPSAVLHADKICVLGNGMVINPEVLCKELENLKSKQSEHAKIFVSNRAHLITSEHIQTDAEEGKNIGTTGRGIGPAYTNKISRKGMRYHNFKEAHQYEQFIEKLQPMIVDTGFLLNQAIKEGKKLLFEGAQATMLDIDHGTYPYVTSSNCSVGGLFTGTGIFVKNIEIVGVSKAYTTRVGAGPFVTELFDNIGQQIRDVGHEFGTTTGRPRRCGWLDTVVLRYAKRINGLDYLAVTKLDILSGLPKIKICDDYFIEGNACKEIPADIRKLESAQPLYLELPGWNEDISKCRSFEELPVNAQKYLQKIEELVGVKIKYIGVGADRDDLIIKN
ncbi:MAG: adenylosuccinate synthetase [Nanoarchaeota archaeon]